MNGDTHSYLTMSLLLHHDGIPHKSEALGHQKNEVAIASLYFAQYSNRYCTACPHNSRIDNTAV